MNYCIYDLGCGCGESGPTDYYLDNDGDGDGAGSATSYCDDPGAGWSLNDTDTNDYCSSEYVGDYYTGNDYGQDDCGVCHYNSSNEVNADFNYFNWWPAATEGVDDPVAGPSNTSKDCAGTCPSQTATFNNPTLPASHRMCYNVIIYPEYDHNTWDGHPGWLLPDGATVNNYGCDACNTCAGDNTLWGPGTYVCTSTLYNGGENSDC